PQPAEGPLAGRQQARIARTGKFAQSPGGRQMTDPFELLRDELVRAAARTSLADRRRGLRRPRWPRTPRGLTAALAALLLAGGVAAAAAPLAGARARPPSR